VAVNTLHVAKNASSSQQEMDNQNTDAISPLNVSKPSYYRAKLFSQHKINYIGKHNERFFTKINKHNFISY
jgi:hypothetical protein